MLSGRVSPLNLPELTLFVVPLKLWLWFPVMLVCAVLEVTPPTAVADPPSLTPEMALDPLLSST